MRGPIHTLVCWNQAWLRWLNALEPNEKSPLEVKPDRSKKRRSFENKNIEDHKNTENKRRS